MQRLARITKEQKQTNTRKMKAVPPKNLTQCKETRFQKYPDIYSLWNPEYSSRNPESRVRNPSPSNKKSRIQYLESETTAWNLESGTVLDSLARREKSIFNLHRGWILFSSGQTVFYSLAALVHKILFLPGENKIHIFRPLCNVFLLK